MKLADLLSESTTDELERLAHEHARSDELQARPNLLNTIEGVLRSYRFMQEFLFNRQPPTFAILTLLLDSADFALATSGFRESVLSETQRVAAAVDSGEILRRDDQLRVYRRVLYQARNNDTLLDSSELAILSVLRQELAISQAEHFLIEHHADLREFWQQDGAFARELNALRSAGVVYVRDGKTVLPEDLVGVIRQVLGLDMSRDASRRLFELLSTHELHEALLVVGAPTSGSKSERVERLVAHMVQPRKVLDNVTLEALRTICKDIGIQVSGSKEEVVRRIVVCVAAGRDVAKAPVVPEPVREERRLDEAQFKAMFSQLRGHELAAILGEFDLRRWGSKELQVATAWESHRSEASLLNCLSSSDLEGILRRCDQRTSGSKAERIERLVGHYLTTPTPTNDRQSEIPDC